jgi:hypothetical protein
MCQGLELTTHLYLVPSLRRVELYLNGLYRDIFADAALDGIFSFNVQVLVF